MSITVFVTDGAERPALAIVRALGSRGATVIVGAEERVSLAATSRYCSRRVTYPSPDRDRAGFEHFLLDFVARERVDVVLPVTDVTTHAVCAHQDWIGRYTAVAVPPLDVFESISDKGALLERAARVGVPTPRTVFIDRPSRLGDVINDVDYPAVVKPTRSRIPVDGGWVRASVHYAYSAAELLHLYQTVPYLSSSPSLIQQRIVGPGIGIFLLFDRGRLVCEFGHRRLREKPPAGGVSVLRESTPVEAEIREYATRLLGNQGWNGVAMMEFKQDSRTQRPYLMEVNGRFWGSLQLAIDAGVDFPFLVTQLALGRCPQEVPRYRLGTKSRWLLGDVDHLCLRLFKGDRELRLPPSAPSRLRTLTEFLKIRQPNMRYEIERFDDPRPFLHELGEATRSLSASAGRTFLRSLGRRPRSQMSDPAIGHVQ